MFLRHTSCPVCPSSDGYAHYSGGSAYCFVCGHFSPATGSPYIAMAKLELDSDDNRMRDMPYDSGFTYSSEAVVWCESFGISVPELIDHNVLWSVSKKQLIFPFYEENLKPLVSSNGNDDAFDKPILWQARNFVRTDKIPKYITHGEKEQVIPVFRSVSPTPRGGSVPVVIVEDCLSAIKTTRLGALAIPCLGSTMGKDKLARLRAVLGVSRPYVVWLDSNMYDKAQQISQRLSMLGCHTRVVWSKEDPKCYDNKYIEEQITLA